MSSPSSGALRLLRAACLTVAVLGLSLAAHVLAGGHAPSAGLTAGLALTVFWVCTVLTWRRLGRVSVTAFLLVSQVVLHGCFEFLSGAPSCVELVHAHAGHLAGGSTIACTGAGADMGTMTHGAMPGPSMMLAHAVAAVLVGLLLAGGERALWFLAGLVWRPLPTRRELPQRAVRAVFTASCEALSPLQPALGGVGRRGPPGWPAAVG